MLPSCKVHATYGISLPNISADHIDRKIANLYRKYPQKYGAIYDRLFPKIPNTDRIVKELNDNIAMLNQHGPDQYRNERDRQLRHKIADARRRYEDKLGVRQQTLYELIRRRLVRFQEKHNIVITPHLLSVKSIVPQVLPLPEKLVPKIAVAVSYKSHADLVKEQHLMVAATATKSNTIEQNTQKYISPNKRSEASVVQGTPNVIQQIPSVSQVGSTPPKVVPQVGPTIPKAPQKVCFQAKPGDHNYVDPDFVWESKDIPRGTMSEFPSSSACRTQGLTYHSYVPSSPSNPPQKSSLLKSLFGKKKPKDPKSPFV